jgi:uncharacterized RmlC-like cupin family protein
MEKLRLIRPEERTPGHDTAGMVREEAVATEALWGGFVTTEAGMVSGWHHHGGHESAIYVLSGGMRLEFGPVGNETIEAEPGDFVFVPKEVVHREGNPTGERCEFVVFRSGSGEVVVNVDGPEG